MADEDIVVTLPDDVSGPIVDQVLSHQSGDDIDDKRVIPDDDDPVADLRSQMAQLTTQNAALASQVTSERTRSQRLEGDLQVARTTVADSNLDVILSGINAAQADADAAQIALQDAIERGHAGDQAKAQRRLSEATSKITPLEMAKSELEQQKKAPPQRAAEPQREAPSDPVEAFLQTRTPASQQWLRGNRQFVGGDGQPVPKLTAAHWSAVAENLAPDSPEYFSHLEKTLGIKQVEKKPEPRVQRRESAPAAPVRSAGGDVSGGQRQVSLTAKEAQSATDGTLVWNFDDPTGKSRFRKGDPIGVGEFARRKSIMMKEGQYDKTLTE